jgi:subtilase family serine protease
VSPGKTRLVRPTLTVLVSIALTTGVATQSYATAGVPARTTRATGRGAAGDVRRACPVPSRPGLAACLALVRTDVRQRGEDAFNDSRPVGFGYGPPQLRSAYRLPSTTAGAGETVAVVDAYDDPTAVDDLAVYRASWGLPACDSTTGAGCLTKVNQNGKTSPLPIASGITGWATEESLDVDMVSAICPSCHIILVEASNPTNADLGTSVNSAVRLGADFVSNSYGGPESHSDLNLDAKYYNHPGIAITASAGDDGYGMEYPAASQYVAAVGGTTLKKSTGGRGWAETVWNGTGSGCSKYEPKPSWQTDPGCGKRTNNDVAAVADPNTGVAIYDSYDEYGWLEVGGTSVASPLIASVYALAGKPAAGTYPASYPYARTADLYDVTSGHNAGKCSPSYLCTAGPGYDGPTGWGTPDGTAAFTG